MRPQVSSPFHVLCGRPGQEDWLRDELAERHGVFARILDPGRVQFTDPLPAAPLLFEWQRMPDTRFYPLAKGESPSAELVAAVWDGWAADPSPWAVHLAPSPDPESANPARLKAVARDLLRAGRDRHPELPRWERKPDKLFRKGTGRILQWSLTARGLLFSSAPPDRLSSPLPGGVLHMKQDPAAPSRSYLKIEEAFARMDHYPVPDQNVIDLGAAPGGWSYAFAKRGCHVTAVDNGPLKINDACIRRIDHLHADGLGFRLSRHHPPVDWLVGDMLVPPGEAFGLLRYWVGDRHCHRLVLNLKLPQKHPLPALAPILDWLAAYPELQVRQLCHDRREVTVFGVLS